MSCCAACGKHGCACGCGPRAGTPFAIYNRPGLPSIDYRVGTYGSFFATMQDALSDADLPALAALRTREADDPCMALIDAWAVTADVITFYQERIANEGYLGTATERYSVLELARLVDYRVRPGVSASVYFAYTVEQGSAPVTIPAGSKAQTVPAPGEQMQAFETAEPLDARYEWNALKPRLTVPPDITLGNVATLAEIWVNGISTNLRANDRLLFVFGDLATGQQAIRRVASIDVDAAAKRTHVVLQPMDAMSPAVFAGATQAIAILDATSYAATLAQQVAVVRARLVAIRNEALLGLSPRTRNQLLGHHLISDRHFDPAFDPALDALWHAIDALNDPPGQSPAPARDFGAFVGALAAAPTLQPANQLRLSRNIGAALGRASDARPQLLLNFRGRLVDNFYAAWTRVPIAGPPAPLSGVFAMRVSASLFGYNAPRVMGLGLNPDPSTKTSVPYISRPDGDQTIDEEANRVYLDNAYDGVQPQSYLVIQASPDVAPVIAQADRVAIHARTAYGISGKTTDVALVAPADGSSGWDISGDATIETHLRTTQVYAQSEKLDLADTPIPVDVGRIDDNAGSAKSITLDAAVDGLKAGSWLIVEGTRTDVPAANAVTAAELVMLEGVTQAADATLSTDTIHSTLHFANDGLAYRYRRDSVAIRANVVRATHGETRREVLGSGDGTRVLQAFALKQSPLTFVSAPTAAGVASTLEVRVNGLRWHETSNLAFAGASDRSYVTSIDDDSATSVTFGNGVHGARLPTGIENLAATYRNGIGAAGNVKARQITLLATKPLGIKEVVNPLPSSGGADADSIEQARDNVPLAIMALDRLVSVRDYADFSRTFAGVGTAVAAKVRDFVHVTIAGADDIPIETTSDLYRNLAAALSSLGDPSLPVRIDVRALRALALSAKVGLAPDYAWELVEPVVRAALLDTFGFQRRRLAQNVYLSEIVACIQRVRGVAWVDIDAFGSIDDAQLIAGFTDAGDKEGDGGSRVAAALTGLNTRVDASPGGFGADGKLAPAEIAYFLPDVPDMLLLQEASA